MITIAHYRTQKLSLQLFVATLVLAFVVYMTFWSFGGHFVSRVTQSPRAAYLIPAVGTAWIGALITSATIAIKIRQLLFEEARAVWIDHGVLVFLRSWYVRIPCDEIVEIACGRIATSTLTSTEAVVLHLRTGGQEKFPTSSIAEPPEVIIRTLNAALNLPVLAERNDE